MIIFTIFSLICLVTLHLRRTVYGGELGGPTPTRNATAGFFTLLWIAYVLVSSFKIEVPPPSPYNPNPSPNPTIALARARALNLALALALHP